MSNPVHLNAGDSLVFIYKEGSVECAFLPLDQSNHIVKKFASYLLVDRDLNLAKESISKLLAISNTPDAHNYGHALLGEAIVSYGRCFGDGEGKTVKLDGNAVYRSRADFLETHSKMLELRHRFFAHSGGTEYEAVLVYAALSPDIANPRVVEVYRGLVRAFSFDEELYNQYVQVINHALDWIKIKIDELYKKIIADLKAADLVELYKKAQFPSNLPPNIFKVIVDTRFDVE